MHLFLKITLANLIFYSLVVFRVLWCLPGIRKKKQTKKDKIRTMVVLGSGGHTGEMMPLVDSLYKTGRYTDFVFVAANSDKLSFLHPLIPPNSKKIRIPRARNVGQSFATSIFTTIIGCFGSIKLVFQRPDMLLVNGPGVCLPVVFVMFFSNFLGITHCSIVFVESICRVDTLSLTGKMIYELCDLFFVHWESLLHLKERAQLIDLYGLNHKKSE